MDFNLGHFYFFIAIETLLVGTICIIAQIIRKE